MAVATGCHVAFIRAIMIGREGLHRDVVLDLFRAAGADNPVSYITTGNVSFQARSRAVPAIVTRVEDGIEAIAGRPKPLFVRTLADLVTMVAADPFAAAPLADATEREVVFLRSTLPPLELPIESTSGNLSVFASSGTELFSVGRGEAPGGLIERLTGEPVTVRAWSTVTMIVRKLSDITP